MLSRQRYSRRQYHKIKEIEDTGTKLQAEGMSLMVVAQDKGDGDGEGEVEGQFIELQDVWPRRRVRVGDHRAEPCDWVLLGKISEAMQQGDQVVFGQQLLEIVVIAEMRVPRQCKRITRILAGDGDAKTYLLGLRYA